MLKRIRMGVLITLFVGSTVMIYSQSDLTSFIGQMIEELKNEEQQPLMPEDEQCYLCDGASGTCLESAPVGAGTGCPNGEFTHKQTCEDNCEMEMPACGNAVVDTGEECDLGTVQNNNEDSLCNFDCTDHTTCTLPDPGEVLMSVQQPQNYMTARLLTAVSPTNGAQCRAAGGEPKLSDKGKYCGCTCKNPKKVFVEDDKVVCDMCNLIVIGGGENFCSDVECNDTAGDRGDTSAWCRAQCGDQGLDEDALELCVADCVCRCDPRSGEQQQDNCIEDVEDDKVCNDSIECYEVCMSDEQHPFLSCSRGNADCCRGSCIRMICPTPDDDGEDGGGGLIGGVGGGAEGGVVGGAEGGVEGGEDGGVEGGAEGGVEGGEDGGVEGGEDGGVEGGAEGGVEGGEDGGVEGGEDGGVEGGEDGGDSGGSSNSASAGSSTSTSNASSTIFSTGNSSQDNSSKNSNNSNESNESNESSDSSESQSADSSLSSIPQSSNNSSDVSSVSSIPIGFSTPSSKTSSNSNSSQESSVSISSVPSSTKSSAQFSSQVFSDTFSQPSTSSIGFFQNSENSTLSSVISSTISSDITTLSASSKDASTTSNTSSRTSSEPSSVGWNDSFSSEVIIALSLGSSARSTFSAQTFASSVGDDDIFIAYADDDSSSRESFEDIINTVKESLVAAASICGNGILETKEECDDSNRRDNDGCSSTCLLEIGICGDGVVQSLLGEQCESGSHSPALSYSCKNCRFLSLYCNDGKLDPGEECDAGTQNSTSPDALCRPDCSLSRCGDGVVDSTEICDDGNRTSGDGCDRYCRTIDSNTLIASDTTVQFPGTTLPAAVLSTFQQQQQQFGFPQYPNYQQLPYQLPLAQLQPLIAPQGVAGETGPAAVAVVASGMAAGLGWMRRKRK
jgi:cysteine-rich repeat protein